MLVLLDAAGIQLSDIDVASFEVSASVAVLMAYLGETAKGNVLVRRQPLYLKAETWHADMGDRDCIELAELVEMTLSGLGYMTSRGTAVPNQVDFVCPVPNEITAALAAND